MRSRLLMVLMFTGVLASCAGEDNSPNNCDLSFEDRIYQPFERVYFTSSADLGDLEISIGEDTPLLVYRDENGPFFFVPAVGSNASTIEVQNLSQCTLSLRIGALEDAPDAVAPLVDDLIALNQILALNIGANSLLDASELGGDVSQADYAMGVMTIRQNEFEAMILALTPIERGRLGGLIKKSGLDQIVADMTPDLPPINALWIPTEFKQIDNAQDLSTRMSTGAHFCTVTRSNGPAMANMISTIAAGSLNEYTAAANTAFSTATFLAFSNAALMCATHPETLSNPVVKPSLDAEEDLEIWAAKTFSVDAKAGPPVNLAQLATGLAFVFNSVFSGVSVGIDVVSNFRRIERVAAALGETVTLSAIKENTGETDFGGWEWKNIDIAGEEWVTVIPTGDIFVQKPCETLCLKPLKVGSERVVFVPKIGKFPYSTPELDIIGSVHPIAINIGPPAIPVEPNQNLVFDYGIDWALDRNMEWIESTQATLEAIIDSTDLKAGFLGYLTPADRTKYPVAIKATALSIGGLRAPENSPEPRYDRTLLVLEELIAGPDGTCISPGEKKELFAIASSKAGEKATIDWAPATMVQNGIFTAPATPGDYTLTATAKYTTQPSISKEVVVTVGDCGCWVSVNGSFLNMRQDFEMRSTYNQVLEIGIIGVNPVGLMIQFPMDSDDIPEGSFMSDVSISDNGIWTSEGINTRITYEADGLHYQGLIAGVFESNTDAIGYASISFRGVRDLNAQACISKFMYDAIVRGDYSTPF